MKPRKYIYILWIYYGTRISRTVSSQTSKISDITRKLRVRKVERDHIWFSNQNCFNHGKWVCSFMQNESSSRYFLIQCGLQKKYIYYKDFYLHEFKQENFTPDFYFILSYAEAYLLFPSYTIWTWYIRACVRIYRRCNKHQRQINCTDVRNGTEYREKWTCNYFYAEYVPFSTTRIK